LASGLAISHAQPQADRESSPPPWSRGSAEEGHLRKNLSYLAPEGGGRLWLFANLLYGLILNLTPLVLGAYIAGHLEGFLLRQLYAGVGHPWADFGTATWVAIAVCALIVSATLVVGWRRFRERDAKPRRSASQRFRAEQIAKYLLLLAAATTVLFVM